MLSGCVEEMSKKEKFIETDWYTLKLYNYCIGNFHGSPGGRVQFDSCSYSTNLGNLINLPIADQYVNYLGPVVINSPLKDYYSFGITLSEEFADSLLHQYGSSTKYQHIIQSELIAELKEFLHLKITVKKRTA